MELKDLKREYNGHYKFRFNEIWDDDEYEKLIHNEDYSKAKIIFIRYYEKLIHFHATYAFIMKILSILTLISLFFINILYDGNMIQANINIILLSIIFKLNSIIHQKKYENNGIIYYFEIISLDILLSQKYDNNYKTDLSEVGKNYVNSL